MNISTIILCVSIWYSIGLITLVVALWKDFHKIVVNKSLFCLSALFGPILTLIFIWNKYTERLPKKRKK